MRIPGGNIKSCIAFSVYLGKSCLAFIQPATRGKVNTENVFP